MFSNLNEMLDVIDLRWSEQKVLVIGDVMLDKYVWGAVERISPEAPVPVVRAVRNNEQPGGAANVAMNLSCLGASVSVIGFTGKDEDHLRLRTALVQNGIEPLLIARPEITTISKLRVLGGNQQILRLDVELGPKPNADAYDELQQTVADQLATASVVILSDYAKGVLSEAVCQSTIEEARKRNIPVLIDPKHTDFRRYRGATTICPNLHELANALHDHSSGLQSMLEQAEAMVPEFDLQWLTVTLSEKGIAVIRDGSQFVAPAVARQVFDVSGAGDTVIAVLALSIASGLPVETAVQLANVAAGIVVSKVGTVPVSKQELMGTLAASSPFEPDQKVFTRDDLVRRTAGWRALGQKVVFTNGCFDLLHIGHITLLAHARREGDRLVVGINSDASVQALKGPTRPIVNEAQRAGILAALGSVDAVVIFDEATPLNLINLIQPDVIVKGGDYTEASVVGAEEVRSWGGRTVIVPTVEGFSTTKLIEKSRPPQKR